MEAYGIKPNLYEINELLNFIKENKLKNHDIPLHLLSDPKRGDFIWFFRDRN